MVLNLIVMMNLYLVMCCDVCECLCDVMWDVKSVCVVDVVEVCVCDERCDERC